MRCFLQGQYQTAISHLKRVLEISREMGDHVGDADAYGTIAGALTHNRKKVRMRGVTQSLLSLMLRR